VLCVGEAAGQWVVCLDGADTAGIGKPGALLGPEGAGEFSWNPGQRGALKTGLSSSEAIGVPV